MRVRLVVAVLTILAGAGLLAGLSAAQAPPPTVTVTLGSGSAVSVAGVEALGPGPTRIEARGPARRPASFSLVALRPGQTLQSLQQAVRRARGPADLKSVASFEASGPGGGGATFATTVDLRAGTTYVVINVSGEPRNFRYAQFTVGDQPTGAVRPQPAATVGLYDYAFGMPSTLPRRGTVRFENRGDRLHFGIAYRLRRAAYRTAAVRALLDEDERRLVRLTVERDTREVIGVVSPGTVNDVEVDLPRAGHYVMVCYVSDGEPGRPSHNRLGMVTPFRVR